MRPYLLVLANLLALSCYSSNLIAISDGDWIDDLTWDKSHPGCYDTIIIPEGITVTITATEDYEACPPMVVFVYGRLEFQTGKKIKLPCGANSGVIIQESGSMGVGGGGGSSTYVTICGDEVWNASMGDITGYLVLPVELCCMNAEMEGDRGLLTWKTKSERNNAGFTVERSSDGIEWEHTGFVEGAGSSSAEIDYAFYDEAPLLGFNYYRLVQQDFDSKTKIFDPILLVNDEPELRKEMFVFPNPLTEEVLTIYISGLTDESVTFFLINKDGNTVLSDQAQVYNNQYCTATIPSDIPQGVYFLQIGDLTERVVVL